MTTTEHSERVKRFGSLVDEKPHPGTVLRAKGGGSVTVWRDSRGGGAPRLFCNAAVDGDATGWFLTSDACGLKCLIEIREHPKILADYDSEPRDIQALKVLRSTRSGTAIMCRVEEV